MENFNFCSVYNSFALWFGKGELGEIHVKLSLKNAFYMKPFSFVLPFVRKIVKVFVGQSNNLCKHKIKQVIHDSIMG